MKTDSPADKTRNETPKSSEGWYRDEVAELRSELPKIDGDIAGFLAASRKDMHDALDKFFARVQNFVGLYIAVFTLVAGISYFWLHDGQQLKALPIAAGVLCLLGGFFGLCIASPGMKALYELYVASVIYASQVHDAMGIGKHRWFDYVREYAEKIDIKDLEKKYPNTQEVNHRAKDEVIKSWMNAKGTSSYKSSLWLMYILTGMSFVAALVLFFLAYYLRFNTK